RILYEALQSQAHRVLPPFTAQPNIDCLPPAITFQLARDFEQIALRDQQRDTSNLGAPVKCLERSPDQRPAPNWHQDPRAGLALMKSGPGCRNDRLYLHSSPLFSGGWWAAVYGASRANRGTGQLRPT